MAKPQVTITLGRSGQKVVKDSWGDSDGGRANAPVASGSKRSLSESSSADHSFSYNKRRREDWSARSYGYSSHNDDSRLDPKDLRLKLKQKRISRRIELENEQRKKVELHEKVSRAIRSLESPDRSLLRNIPSSGGAVETLHGDSMRSSYASWTSNGVRTRSPDRFPRSSAGISTPRSAMNELPRVPSMRTIDASRTGPVLLSKPMESSRPKVPVPSTSRGPLDSGKLVPELAPAPGGISRSPYPESQPLTVSTLLHSIGLGKYSINFQAEEIDMVALKQMGDSDLKELGIPMGPRKKILLALQARAKRPATQAHINYMQ
ncbi:hypothetical protein Salat_2185600 [Sesamum alatum]|uniref:SAM domain-containing protein n=1 Tax=Sesamum alatum TaxID=300844 RepID=A0AAE1XTI2_9LAMI|nr:hypothetical protein Salat_2185600 [Sesamum alatum]